MCDERRRKRGSWAAMAYGIVDQNKKCEHQPPTIFIHHERIDRNECCGSKRIYLQMYAWVCEWAFDCSSVKLTKQKCKFWKQLKQAINCNERRRATNYANTSQLGFAVRIFLFFLKKNTWQTKQGRDKGHSNEYINCLTHEKQANNNIFSS